MVRSYLPGADAALLAFTDNFSRLITETPAEYSLTEPDAIEYGTKQALFASRLQAATDPLTRGKRTVFLKQEAKKQLVAATRTLGRQIVNAKSVTDDQRLQLGLTIRDTTRTPAPPPSEIPHIKVRGINGRIVTIQLQQDSSTSGKPSKVTGATIHTCVSPTKPTDVDQWTFAGNTNRTRVDLPFGPSETGDTVWISASWTNARGSGPGCEPISVNLPAGGVVPTEAIQSANLKLAA